METTIGQAAQQVIDRTAETDSPAPSIALTKISPANALEIIQALPDRLDDAALELVAQIAGAPLPMLPRSSPEHFASCLRCLSILPRRNDDDSTGEHRAKIYARLLGEYPAEALSFMTRTAQERCKWLPSIAECKSILSEWHRADDAVKAQTLALRRHEDEWQARLAEASAKGGNLTQAEIDAMAPWMRKVLEVRSVIWRMPSGDFRPRKGSWADALADDEASHPAPQTDPDPSF